MATTKKTPEEIEEILQLQETVAIGTKFAINQISSWYQFINWCSSYDSPISSGDGDADVVLTQQHSSEFGFSLSKIHKEHFAILAQPSNYEWFSKLNIKAIMISSDGVTFFIDALNEASFYISKASFKLKTNSSLSDILRKARHRCKFAQIGCVDFEYNFENGSVSWDVKSVQQKSIPIIKDVLELSEIYT